MKQIKKELTAKEIYELWEIPRNMLQQAVNAPCPVRMREIVLNGVPRKKYLTQDVVDYFNCDMTDKVIEG